MISEAVASGGGSGYSWVFIENLLGTFGEAARQRCKPRRWTAREPVSGAQQSDGLWLQSEVVIPRSDSPVQGLHDCFGVVVGPGDEERRAVTTELDVASAQGITEVISGLAEVGVRLEPKLAGVPHGTKDKLTRQVEGRGLRTDIGREERTSKGEQVDLVHDLRAERVLDPEAVHVDEVAAGRDLVMAMTAGHQDAHEPPRRRHLVVDPRPVGVAADANVVAPAAADPAADLSIVASGTR